MIRQHQMCDVCAHCMHCSRTRQSIEEGFVDCAGSPPHRHSLPMELRGPPWMMPDYVPEWCEPLARTPRDAA